MSGAPADPPGLAGLLKIVPQLGIGIIALLLLAGVLYLQMQERRFEAARADRDRDQVTLMLRDAIERGRQDREESRLRSQQFLEGQARAVAEQRRIADAMTVMASEASYCLQGVERLQVFLREENRVLLERLQKKATE